MKYVIAIIRPHKLEDVMRELDNEEIHLRTVSEVLAAAGRKASRRYTGASGRREIS